METLVYDIESNGFLNDVTKLHCIVTKHVDTQEVTSYYTSKGYIECMERLREADRIIAHNQIGYDLQVLKKLYDFQIPDISKIFDTLVLSRLANPDRRDGHSLKVWAERAIREGFTVPPKYMIEDWSNQSLEDYLMRCTTDVEINEWVYKFLLPQVQGEG